MSNRPFIFERIIGGNLRPWLDENMYEDNFASIIGNLELIVPRFQSLYEIDFYPFFSNKTRYYHKLIINEANNYCNHVIELINSDNNIQVIRCLLTDTFKNKLKTLLKESANLIKANGWKLKYINPYKSNFDTEVGRKTNTYII